MRVRGTGIIFDLSVGLAFAVAFFGVGCWIGRQGTQELERWQRCLSDRRTPTGHGWEQLTSLDGAVELSHANGTANGTTTATARNTAHGTTHTTAYYMTLGAASGKAAGILDGSIQDGIADATTDATEDATAIGNNDITDQWMRVYTNRGRHEKEWFGLRKIHDRSILLLTGPQQVQTTLT